MIISSPSLNKLDQYDYDGNDQQDMNEITHRIAGYQSQQPQNHEYYSNRPQHVMILLSDRLFSLPAIYITIPAGCDHTVSFFRHSPIITPNGVQSGLKFSPLCQRQVSAHSSIINFP